MSALFATVIAAYVADADWNPNHGNQASKEIEVHPAHQAAVLLG